MADAITVGAAGAVTAASAAASFGMPSGAVLFASLVGALASVWLQHGETAALSRQWLVRAVGALFVALAFGAISPALIQLYGPSFSWLAPLAKLEPAVIAVLAALVSHRAVALFDIWSKRRAEK